MTNEPRYDLPDVPVSEGEIGVEIVFLDPLGTLVELPTDETLEAREAGA